MLNWVNIAGNGSELNKISTNEVENDLIVAQPAKPKQFTRGETPWHKNWKIAFPGNYREIGFYDEIFGEIHRADIHTPDGVTIEFQNSPISLNELKSREAFYPKLIWILNGKKFKGFRILKNLPDVDDPALVDYEFCHSDHLSMIRKEDVIKNIVKPKILNFYHPELKRIAITSHYYSFCWKQPHAVWFEAKAPLIIDPGGHFLYELRKRKQVSGDYAYVKLIPRKTFIESHIAQ